MKNLTALWRHMVKIPPISKMNPQTRIPEIFLTGAEWILPRYAQLAGFDVVQPVFFPLPDRFPLKSGKGAIGMTDVACHIPAAAEISKLTISPGHSDHRSFRRTHR